MPRDASAAEASVWIVMRTSEASVLAEAREAARLTPSKRGRDSRM